MDRVDVWVKLIRLIMCVLNRGLKNLFFHMILDLSELRIAVYELGRNALLVPSPNFIPVHENCWMKLPYGKNVAI